MNKVLYWNSVLLEASRRDFTKGYVNGQQPGPIRTSRAMAIVHLAIHDAVAFRNQAAAAYLNKKASCTACRTSPARSTTSRGRGGHCTEGTLSRLRRVLR